MTWAIYNFPLSSPWQHPRSGNFLGMHWKLWYHVCKMYIFSQHQRYHIFSPTRPLWAELVIESPCPSVCVSVCLSAPLGAVFFEASHWSSNHMTRWRPLIGQPFFPTIWWWWRGGLKDVWCLQVDWKLNSTPCWRLNVSDWPTRSWENIFFKCCLNHSVIFFTIVIT